MSAAPFQPLGASLDEGDILANVPFPVWRDGTWEAKNIRGIITSHGCACEDYDRALTAGQTSKARKVKLHIAPIRPITGQPEDKLQGIRDGEVWRYFYVYGEAATLSDQLVDLDAEQALPASVLAGLDRITRLASWQWRALLLHVTVNRWARSPEEIFGIKRAEELRQA